MMVLNIFCLLWWQGSNLMTFFEPLMKLQFSLYNNIYDLVQEAAMTSIQSPDHNPRINIESKALTLCRFAQLCR